MKYKKGVTARQLPFILGGFIQMNKNYRVHTSKKNHPNQQPKNVKQEEPKELDPMDLIPENVRDDLSFLLSVSKEIADTFEECIADFNDLSCTLAFHHATASTPACYKHLFSVLNVKNELLRINNEFENAFMKASLFKTCCENLTSANPGYLVIDIDEMEVYFGKMVVYRDTTISPLLSLLNERLYSFIGLMKEDYEDDNGCPCNDCNH